jgi:hypothetical protein
MANASTNHDAKTSATNDQPAADADNSDRALVSNYSAINVAPGMGFIDFGFLEPAMLAALQRAGKGGGPLPERLDGKLAVRVVMGYDAMNALYQQLGWALAGVGTARNATPAEESAGRHAAA